MVDMRSEINVRVNDADGTESLARMSEGRARALLGLLGIDPPPVLCNQHDNALGVMHEMGAPV
jgi:hypothetical protein